MNAQRAFRELEHVDRRVLGALCCVDASTGAPIEAPLQVIPLDGPPDVEPAPLRRNRSGLFVIEHWAPLAAHAASFEAPLAQPLPGSQTLRLAVQDPSGRYLPRIVAIDLPRAPDADPAGDGLFAPRRVPLYPAAHGATGANWSLLRVSVAEAVSGDPLGGALLRVRRNGVVLARGLSDWRGEALVAVVGVPVTTFSEDENAVVVSRIDVTLDAAWDPRPARDSSGLRTPLAELRAGRVPPTLPQVDPDVLEAALLAEPAALARGSVALSIAAREALPRRLTLALPP